MKRTLNRAVAGLGAAALLVSSLLVTGTAASAAGTGTIVVNVVDQYGRPTPAVIQVLDTTGVAVVNDPGVLGGSTRKLTVPAGGYAAYVLTTWSGLTCFGASPCDALSPPTTYLPFITVTDGGVTNFTASVVVPTIAGKTKIGTPLTVQLPPALTSVLRALTIEGLVGGVGQQWMRGTTAIPGATAPSYTTTGNDGKKSISAQLTPPPGLQVLLGGIGLPVLPMTTNTITMKKYDKPKTTTTVKVPSGLSAGQSFSVTVKVAAKKGKPDGDVTLTMGAFKTRKSVKRGSAFITLPRLSAGTYTLQVKYGGSATFAASKSTRVTFTVRR